jgi:hypothetical protein
LMKKPSTQSSVGPTLPKSLPRQAANITID